MLLAVACGSAAPRTVTVPETAHLSMTGAVARLCGAGFHVRLDETSPLPNIAPSAVPADSASPAFTPPAGTVRVTGTTPAAGAAVPLGAVVTLRVEAPGGTFAVIRLPTGCQAPSSPTAPTTTG